jgi:hypothetical protein
VSLPGDTVTIHKFDTAGREMLRWHAVVRRAETTSIQVEARFNAPEVDRAGLAFRRGDRLLETYFTDRCYNIFAVYDADTPALKGWYCNVSRPARLQDSEVTWVDLALDVIVLPDGRTAVLDEEEFAALRIPEDDRRAARQAVDELLRAARAGSGPFASTEGGDPTRA